MLEFTIYALATWRLASLLAAEAGPLDILSRLRVRLGVEYTPDDKVLTHNELARGLVCVWCNSVWIGMGWALAWYLWPVSWWLAAPLALSAVAVVVQKIVD